MTTNRDHRSAAGRWPARTLQTCIVLMTLLLTYPALAQETAPQADANDYGASFLRDFERASDKLLQLADAIPAEKYNWRPAEGVRSVSEVFVHLAFANANLSRIAAGIEPPAGFDRDAEKNVTAKAETIAMLRKSQDLIRRALAERNGDFLEQVDFFWGPAPVRDVFLQMAAHNHEHLGQMIAYARSVGVAPPWSRPRAGS